MLSRLLRLLAIMFVAWPAFAQQQINLGPTTPVQVKGVVQPLNQYVYVGALGGLPGTCSVGALAFVTGVTPGQNDYRCTSTNVWTLQGNANTNGLGNGTTVIDASTMISGSVTGGIQEAINASSTPGEVIVAQPVTSTAAINMKVGVNVRCFGPNVAITFTASTNGFVWPNTAISSGLYGCNLVAGNGASGKAIDIEDGSQAASGVVVEDVIISATNPPTTQWAFGRYLSNALLDRFINVQTFSATVGIHTDGISNSVDFVGENLTENVTSTTYVDLQGGNPINFIGGYLEGSASGEIVKITQPGSAATFVQFFGTGIENANGTGKGIHANGGRFSWRDGFAGVTGPLAFVIGDTATTYYCKISGGFGGSWTLGADSKFTSIENYSWSGSNAPVDSSLGSNTFLNVHHTDDTSFNPPQQFGALVVAPSYCLGTNANCLTDWKVPWSSLLAPIGNTTISMGTTNTGFNFTSNSGFMAWINTTAATLTVPQSSPALFLYGNYWTAGSASAPDSWSIFDQINSGISGASTLTFTHTGTPGGALVSVPNLLSGGIVQAGGSNIVYRCATDGALPTGALTAVAGACGSSTDTGLRVQ